MTSIYLLGDSHTAAIGPRLKKLFPGATFRYESFSGHSTARAQEKANIARDQNLVVLSLGGNDFGDRAKEREKLVEAVKARNPGAWILWFGPFHALGEVGARHNVQAESQSRQLPGLKVVWADTRAWARNRHSADNVHFTGSGYEEIAAQMKPRMDELLLLSSGGADQPVGPIPEPLRENSGWLLLLLAGGAGVWWYFRRKGR